MLLNRSPKVNGTCPLSDKGKARNREKKRKVKRKKKKVDERETRKGENK